MTHSGNGWRFFTSRLSRLASPLTMAVCFLALASITGCATWGTKEERVTLAHTQHKVKSIPEAASLAVSVHVNDKRDDLAPGISRKWGKAVVGYGRNGLGEKTYPNILVKEPVALTVKQSLESELRARGFRIADNAKLQITIDIKVFFNDYRVGFIRSDAVADLNMDVRILSSGNSRYSRQIAAQGHSAWANTMGSRDAETALNMALNNGIDALFNDGAFVSALLARE